MRFDFSEKRLEFFLHHLIDRRLLGTTPLVGETWRYASLRRLQRRRHDLRSSAASA
jgi:hypothetical protein